MEVRSGVTSHLESGKRSAARDARRDRQLHAHRAVGAREQAAAGAVVGRPGEPLVLVRVGVPSSQSRRESADPAGRRARARDPRAKESDRPGGAGRARVDSSGEREARALQEGGIQG